MVTPFADLICRLRNAQSRLGAFQKLTMTAKSSRLIFARYAEKGIEQIQLTVVTDNHAAVHLYKKHGFKTYGIQKDFFKRGEKYWDLQFMQLMRKNFLEKKEAFSKSEIQNL